MEPIVTEESKLPRDAAPVVSLTYLEGHIDGVVARKSGKYSNEEIAAFLRGNKPTNGYNAGFTKGLSGGS